MIQPATCGKPPNTTVSQSTKQERGVFSPSMLPFRTNISRIKYSYKSYRINPAIICMCTGPIWGINVFLFKNQSPYGIVQGFHIALMWISGNGYAQVHGWWMRMAPKWPPQWVIHMEPTWNQWTGPYGTLFLSQMISQMGTTHKYYQWPEKKPPLPRAEALSATALQWNENLFSPWDEILLSWSHCWLSRLLKTPPRKKVFIIYIHLYAAYNPAALVVQSSNIN